MIALHASSVLLSLLISVCADTNLKICCRQRSVPQKYDKKHHFALTTKVYLSQHCTSVISWQTLSLAVPLVYPGAFSSSSLIPVLSGSCGGTVWEQTGAAYNGHPAVANRLVHSSFWSPTELCYMCRKTWVKVSRFQSLVCRLPASVRPQKSLWG